MKFRAHHTTQLLRTDEVPRRDVRLVVVDDLGVTLRRFAELPALLREGDLVVVNDAATLPASLRGVTAAGEPFELRLSAPLEGTRLTGVVFGPGDHTTRTEHRAPPPPLGDAVTIAGLRADVVARDGRRVELAVRATPDALLQAIYASGRPVQYAHRRELLALYDVQTAYATRPWAAEMPSAGRPLTWDVLLALRRRGIAIERLTHAAGLSSTGDAALDAALPWPERYEIPARTVAAVARTKAQGGRVIAIGTTVVRALESAALAGELSSGAASTNGAHGIATLVLGPASERRVVDGIVSGLHAPGESHFELLSAFAPREQLVRAIELAAANGLSAHELGDSCLVLR
ncbi:MAG: S-adenosylmethionine:tRNA ribosyltransferase-isomerase [Deltaproteobacteria bacterium]|nr:S-adenosylmethionine:tRNA ribosyltransferase-isomerase [Deltaproteobacteria bacterium]